MDLEILVKNFQQKDIKAFERLYEMYAESMSGVIYSIVKDESLTQELLQDVFVKAWKAADSYSPSKGRFFTWLMRIARNTAFDALRSKAYKNASKNINSDVFANVLETKENLDGLTDTIGLKAFIAKLTEKCKALIEIIYFKGYSQKDASEELEIPLGTVKTRSRRCLRDLKILLEE